MMQSTAPRTVMPFRRSERNRRAARTWLSTVRCAGGPPAGHVALLAHKQYTAGRRDDLWQLVPVYSRLSAAEEKRRGK